MQGDAGRVSELRAFNVEQLVAGGGVAAGKRLEVYVINVCWIFFGRGWGWGRVVVRVRKEKGREGGERGVRRIVSV